MVHPKPGLVSTGFTTTFDARGAATVSSPPAQPVTVERIYEESNVAVYVGPLWPTLYVAYGKHAREFLASLPGEPGGYEELDGSVLVSWLLPGTELMFVDLADVMSYALLAPQTAPPAMTDGPNPIRVSELLNQTSAYDELAAEIAMGRDDK